MKTKKILGLLTLFFVLILSENILYADASDTLELKEFYEQNGDCYLLIGDSITPTNSGVYQLNNLTSGSVSKLYNPGDAYGITAGLAVGSDGNPEKSLYTFYSKNRTTSSGNGTYTTRPMLATWSYGVWQSSNSSTPDNVAPAIVHRYHTLPNDADTGIGNHTSDYGLSYFDGKCIPCSIAPVADGVNDDGETVYRYKIGEEWYHTVDHPAYSRYTYCPKGGSYNWYQMNYGGSPVFPDGCMYKRLQALGVSFTWMNDSNATRWANDPDYHYDSTRYGGWVHYVAKESVINQTEQLWLQDYIVGSGFNSSLEQYITNVVVGASSTMSMKGECIDGCITAVDNISLPGEPAPYLDTAYSAQTGASYVYTRSRGSSTGSITGLRTTDQVVGTGNDITTRFVGISSKNATGNYVYLLGSAVINQWLDDLNMPEAMKIANPDDLADVAVSDQWWQNGGIVYAYDKAKKKVYCFVRDESNSSSDIPKEINAELDGGQLPDRIGADGFGSLYFLKTDIDPNTDSPEIFYTTPAASSYFVKNENTGIYNNVGQKVFRRKYKQRILKSVYKKPYGSDAAPELLAQNVLVHTNYYYRLYTTVNDKINGAVSTWEGVPYAAADVIDVNDVSGRYRSELAVINCPTPPRPDHVRAVCDCNGPMIHNSTTHQYEMATPDSDGYHTSENINYFMVENSPYFDSNLVNIGNTDVDIDGDTVTGRFPNTIKNESIEYYWQIRRIVDRDGNSVDEYAEENQVLNDGAGGHIIRGNYILPFPSLIEKGTYKVGVKVKYRFYDYSQLPVGALSSDKESCLTSLRVASSSHSVASDSGIVASYYATVSSHPEDEGFSWEIIKFRPVDPPPSINGNGVIMTNAGSGYLPGEACGSPCSDHPQCADTINPATPTFILDGYTLCKTVEYDEGTGAYTAIYPEESRDYRLITRLDPSKKIINWGLKLRDNTHNLNNGLDRIAILTGEPPIPSDTAMIPGSLEWLDHPYGQPLVNNLTVQWVAELKISDTDTKQFKINKTGSSSFELTKAELRELFPVPSEPNCYTLSCQAQSTYQYSFMDYGPRMVEGGRIIYDYHPAQNQFTITIRANAKVCVTDNQSPYLMVYDAYTRNIVPGYAMKYSSSSEDYVKARTGETIDHTDGGKTLTFYVADNNPFANYDGTAACSGNDIYHYSSSGSKKRLKVSRNLNNRKAYLYNENCSHVKVKANETTSPTVVTYGEDGFLFSNLITPLPNDGVAIPEPSSVIAFTKYEFSSSDLGSFTNIILPTDLRKSIAFDYASNKPGYTNLKFGIRWKETSSLELSETNFKNIASYSLGTIVSIDNDRPNVYVTATQEKFPENHFTRPIIKSRLRSIASDSSTTDSWFQTISNTSSSYYDNQGPELWDLITSASPSVDQYFNNSFFLSSTDEELTREIFVASTTLLPDTPVTFNASANDNVGSCTIESICIRRVEDDELYAGSDGTDLSDEYPSIDNKMIQCVFRDRVETKYYVKVTVRDDARGYPASANDDPTDVSLMNDSTINRRILKAYFTVYPSRLDYRILDRDIRH